MDGAGLRTGVENWERSYQQNHRINFTESQVNCSELEDSNHHNCCRFSRECLKKKPILWGGQKVCSLYRVAGKKRPQGMSARKSDQERAIPIGHARQKERTAGLPSRPSRTKRRYLTLAAPLALDGLGSSLAPGTLPLSKLVSIYRTF